MEIGVKVHRMVGERGKVTGIILVPYVSNKVLLVQAYYIHIIPYPRRLVTKTIFVLMASCELHPRHNLM